MGTATDLPEGYRVREARRGDREAVVGCWRDLVADQDRHGAHILPDRNVSTAAGMLGQQIVAGNVAVATVAEAVVGFVTYHLERGAYDQDVTRGIVENVYVDPDHRDRGLGSALLSLAERELAARGADVIAITALAPNEGAQRLYRARGYRPHRITFERRAPDENDSSSTGGA